MWEMKFNLTLMTTPVPWLYLYIVNSCRYCCLSSSSSLSYIVCKMWYMSTVQTQATHQTAILRITWHPPQSCYTDTRSAMTVRVPGCRKPADCWIIAMLSYKITLLYSRIFRTTEFLPCIKQIGQWTFWMFKVATFYLYTRYSVATYLQQNSNYMSFMYVILMYGRDEEILQHIFSYYIYTLMRESTYLV